MTLTIEAARAVVRQPGLHLSDIVNDTIRVMKDSREWTDWQETDALERVIAREGRPVRHDEAHDFNHASALHGPSVLAWGGMAIGVVVGWVIVRPLALRGLQAIARFVWVM